MDQNAYHTEKRYEEKKKRLLTLMDTYDHPVIACSAGADSALLTQLAFMRHPDTALAVFVSTEGTDEAERDYAAEEAMRHGWRLRFLNLETFRNDAVLHNRRDRCYHCKKMICEEIRCFGKTYGGKHFLEGSNDDDRSAYRPGERAVADTGFISPLAEAGFSKADVRRFGAELGLNSAIKPSAPCLLTRFPYDLENGVIKSDIKRIKNGEHQLKETLSDNFRLRYVDSQTARIEASAADQNEIKAHFKEITKGLPFSHIILDDTPFQSGSYDRKDKNSR